MSGRDYYQVLGVSRDASTADIRAAFVHLARLHHPDTSDRASAPAWRLKDVQQAYHCLSDSASRSAHDQELADVERRHFAHARKVRHRLRRFDHRRQQAPRFRHPIGWRPLLVFLMIAGIAAAIIHAID